MSTIFGMAIQITEKNASKLSIVNGGREVWYQENIICYFVFPYDPEGYCTILAAETFFDNYEFVDEPNTEAFVDVREK